MAVTVDFSPSAAGNIFFEDDGIPGNTTGQFRHSAGDFATFPLVYPADSLFLYYAAGQRAYFNLFDALGAANLTVGKLANPATHPDAINVRKVETTGIVTMATTGSVTEWGNDLDTDIFASRIELSAGTGIGTPSNALETQAFLLEAETTTGGINIRNIGSTLIGGDNPQIAGLSAATSGNIVLEVRGTITLADTDGSETIKGGSASGNVVLNATSVAADITSTVDNNAVTASAGSVILNASRNIVFGAGTNFGNDIRADANVTINAGGEVSFDGLTDIISDGFGHNTGGDVTVTAANGILIRDLHGAGATIAANGTGGGNVTLSAGFGGTLDVASTGSAAILSNSGDVTANVDRVFIENDSGISAPNGKVTLRPYTAGLGINLGMQLNSDFVLYDFSLDRIFAESLVIGGTNAGTVTVAATVTPANVQDLLIQSGSDVIVNAGGFLAAVGDLTLKAGADITLIAGAIIFAGGTVTGYVDVGNADPGEGGRAFVDAAFGSAVRFFGGTDRDTLMGGAVNDWLDGSAGVDTMIGRAGDDTYTVDNAGDVTTEASGEGIDTVRTSLSWTLAANVDVLTLLGGGGINGTGNAIANTLNGNSGDNTLSGLGNLDTLLGNGGNDTLLGGDGNDLLNGGAGNDIMDGGNQIDTASYAGAAAAVTVALVGGAQATGGSGSDTIANVENLTGSSHSDKLTGNNAVNVLTGFDGNDVLNGLGGNDTLLGDLGTDTLVGGTGRDFLTGGAGDDIFDFNAIGETGATGTTRDQIIDFAQGSDKLDLATIDASTLAAGNQAFAFIGAAAFSGVAGQLRSVANATVTVILGDVNGDSTADFHIQLNTPWTLTAGDFVL